ncbi:MAG: YihY/virulence factor BrkB family protein [candidate division Zixibacteria bacterium]|nr:YihY/virulence factor BrkB family protein [candidate division Zixibacteria bacterium]
MRTLAAQVIRFVTHDMWRIPVENLTRGRAFALRQLRILYLAWSGFREDNLSVRASALTFYSILSAVPVFAILFGIAKGFGFEDTLQGQILEEFPNQREALATIFNVAHTTLAQSHKGWVTGIGAAILFWSVLKVLGSIEASFNDIWNIGRGRSLFRKFADYVAIILICPLTLIISGALTLYISTQISDVSRTVEVVNALSPALLFMLKGASLVLVLVMFTFLYMVMPNTRVRFKAGLVGGVVAGTAFHLMQFGYVRLQVGVAKYNAVYGSFAALPLFLVWLQLSWFIVLLGAELAYAVQNADTYDYTSKHYKLSTHTRRLLSLVLAHTVVKAFADNQPAPTSHDIARKLGMPFGLVQRLCTDFVDCGVLSRVGGSEALNPAYQPAHDINTMTVQSVIESLEGHGTGGIPAAPSTEVDKFSATLSAFEAAISNLPSNRLMKDI